MKAEMQGAITRRSLRIPVGKAMIHADLNLPTAATGLVLFAHGSGSSRSSPRNHHLAQRLNRAGLSTVLADLLTQEEEADIELLAHRVVALTLWFGKHLETGRLPIGYFGASAGAGAALIAAVQQPSIVRAVVSRGGRPELAGDALARVVAPTLLLVGGHDESVIELNQRAFAHLRCEKVLSIVPGATHLLEEPGIIDTVADRACEWFLRYVVDSV